MTAITIGRVSEIVRYPVKSMAGTAIEESVLGWHGLAGDRRFAFRRVEGAGGFPWLTASRLPEMLSYRPVGQDHSSGEPLPTHILTSSGTRLEPGSRALDDEISERFGSRVELMRLNHGIFDEAAVSVISLATIAAIGAAAEFQLDRRRFRANLLIDTDRNDAFSEDQWVGGRLIIGDESRSAILNVTMSDLRCVMINLDPETCEQNAEVLRTVTRLNDSNAGVYATVVGTGTIRKGDRVRFAPDQPDG